MLQITARRDYAVGRALEKGGILAMMATELAVPGWAVRHAKGPFSRYVVNLPAEKVAAAPLTGLAYRAAMRFSKRHAAWPHIWAARRTAKLSIPKLKRQKPNIVFGIDTGAIELFEAFDRETPRPRLVLEQCVAPRRTQLEMVEHLSPYFSEEEKRARIAYIEAHRVREEAEWRLADIIVVPSAYVAEEVEKAGADPAKIRLVPYGYTPDANIGVARKKDRPLPLRGLFVGLVDHRKGVQDLAVAATPFEGQIGFDVYGKLAVEQHDLDEWGKTLRLHGPKPFEQIKAAYAQADFLVLPSYLEGSAMVVYEAMAYGLPCVVTRETGSIITDGENGFIVDAGDPDGLKKVFETILADPARLDAMSEKAAAAAGEVSDTSYSERLIAAILS